MKGAQLRAGLEARGENKTVIGKKKVADLKVLLKQKCGITQAAANRAHQPKTPGQLRPLQEETTINWTN